MTASDVAVLAAAVVLHAAWCYQQSCVHGEADVGPQEFRLAAQMLEAAAKAGGS